MWSNDSTTYGHGCIRHCVCHTAILPCLCTYNPLSHCYNNNNVLPNSTALLGIPQTPSIYGFSNSTNPVNQEAFQQMAANEFDSWLLPYSDHNYDHSDYSSQQGQFYQMQPQGFHANYYGDFGQSSRERLVEQQQQEDEMLKFSQGIQHDFSLPASLSQVSLPPMDASSILPEATIGNMDLPLEWTPNRYSSLPPRHVNIIDEAVVSHSNSTSISSEGTHQLLSRDASHKPSSYVPMSRQDRIKRYIEKKKTRKYVNKKIYSSRKMYAQIRPRICGRFARTNSQTDI